jgi:hypothetical protein
VSDKQKKFEPSMGWLVAINYQQVAVDRVAKELKIDSVELGKALERSGYLLEPDPFGYSSDTWKVLEIENRKLAAVPDVNE